MDALWSLEDKWKLTTQEALLLFVCTAITVIGLCTATILKRKAQRKEIVDREDGREKWAEPSCNWVSIKRNLMGSVRWSGANKWEERMPPLLGLKEGYQGSVGWQSHNSDSPPVDHSLKETSPKPDIHQEKPVAVVRTTLKDLL
ncbi:hypothetical protein Patl1_04953 [Pistacia atlantica]|uniref:Uncharacterized protein n=1 Tax=Pistacia atlantica TaxID=434234 RepID=A0ACC1BR31_9ROSI|nr:hypothetical protein Patl1_04953 [Pistacia atlantica]